MEIKKMKIKKKNKTYLIICIKGIKSIHAIEYLHIITHHVWLIRRQYFYYVTYLFSDSLPHNMLGYYWAKGTSIYVRRSAGKKMRPLSPSLQSHSMSSKVTRISRILMTSY